MTSRVALVVGLLLASCTSSGGAGNLRIDLVLEGDQVRVETVTPTAEAPTELRSDLAIRVTVRDGAGVIHEASVPDYRAAFAEIGEGEETEVPTAILDDGITLSAVVPRPASGRGEIVVAFTDLAGQAVERTVVFDAPDAVGASAAPIVEPAAGGDVGARRASLGEVCPDEQLYGRWPGRAGSEERLAYHGCGEMRHVGGAADPTGKMLYVILPAGGWGGDIEAFVASATTMVSEMLARNEWFRDHAAHLSFYALADPITADGPAGGCSLGTTINLAAQSYYKWRFTGAEYGPAARGTGVEPDIIIGLINNTSRCNGWASNGTIGRLVGDPGTVGYVTMATDLGCYSTVETIAECSMGDRLAHELGHAQAGLADEYNGSTCGYPNYDYRTRVSWRCAVGASPQIECPDHAPPVRASYLRFYRNGETCVRPCSDSLMRGWYSRALQFDAVAYAAMTNALNGEIGTSLDDGMPDCTDAEAGTCQPSCEGIDCGVDGCDGSCPCSCMTGNNVCGTALGTGVCRDGTGCARTIDLVPWQCSGVTRSERTYVRSTCSASGWMGTDCTVYDNIVDCLADE